MKKEIPADLLTRLRSGYALPALSPVALKLVGLASKDSSSAKDIADLTETDPSLAVRLLKLANSAFYRTSNPVTTIHQAVVKVGFRRLRIMALTISLRDTLPFGKVGPIDFEEFWRISLYRGLLARALAVRLKTHDPDEAFVAGFITEVGLLIFFDIFIRGRSVDANLELEPLEDLITWERKKYGVDHREIGEAALTYWEFPEPIILCQKAYRSPLSNEDLPPLSTLYEQARVLSRIMVPTSEAFHLPFEEAERSFGLDHDVINDILLIAFDQVQDIANILSVEMSKEKDLIEIVEKANGALSRISEKMFDEEGITRPHALPTFDSLYEDEESHSQTLQAVVHEIRNPLLVVGGLARKLATSMDPDSSGGRYIQIILEEASRLEKALSAMVKDKESEH
jgi:HD-like signal output (HDOD) protein